MIRGLRKLILFGGAVTLGIMALIHVGPAVSRLFTEYGWLLGIVFVLWMLLGPELARLRHVQEIPVRMYYNGPQRLGPVADTQSIMRPRSEL